MADEDGLNTQPEELSLRDQIAANLAEAKEDAPVEAIAEVAVEETAEQKAGRTAGRPRDEKGRLLPGKAAAQESTSVPLAADASSPPVAAAPKRPSTWGKETWPVYDKLASGQPITPEEAKIIVDTVHKREADFASGVSTYKQEWNNAKPLIDAITPFMPELQQHNIEPAQWIQNLGNAHRALALGSPQEKLATVQHILANNRIPAQLAVQDAQGNWQLLGQQQMPQQPQFNPADISRLVRQEIEGERVTQTVAEFERNAPEHYAVVKQDMAGLLQAGLADDLQSAYDAAIRLPKHNDIFESIQQQNRQAEELKAKDAQKQKVNRARSQSVSVSSSTPSGNQTSGSEKGLREQLTENFRAVAGGRV